MQGLSLGPADLAANRRMKTTRAGGGHPGYLVRNDPPVGPDGPDIAADRATYQQDLWHYTIARMVDACVMHGILPFYGPFGDIADTVACEDQFRNAYLLGCVGAWSLHPAQIDIAKRVFSPDPADVEHAQRARSDGRRHRRRAARRQDGRRRFGQAVPCDRPRPPVGRSRPRTRDELRTRARTVTAAADELRPRRSVLYMPAANERALEKAQTIAADAIIFDLEDGGRSRRQARRSRQSGRRGAVGSVRQPGADDPLQRPRHRLGSRRHRSSRSGTIRRQW